MHYWGLLGFIITAVGASSGYCPDSAPNIARAFRNRFDISTIHTTHVVVFKPGTGEPVKQTDFSYKWVIRGEKLIKRDGNWVSIHPDYVTIDSCVTIDISKLSFQPNTRYKIGYQASEDGRAKAESDSFVPLRRDKPYPSVSEVSTSIASTAPTDIFSSESSLSQTQTPESSLSQTQTPESSLSQTQTPESSLNQTQTPIGSWTPASITAPASSAPGGSSNHAGAATPCITFSLSTWFWSLLLFPVLGGF